MRDFLFAVVVFIAGVVAALGRAQPGEGPAAPAAPEFAIKPYLIAPGRTEMTIAWTSPAQGTFTLRYGEGEALGNVLRVEPVPEPIRYPPRPAAGTSPPAPGAPAPTEQEKLVEYQYLARLTDLRPGTAYRYAVASRGLTVEGRFRTFPEATEDFVFVASGDSQNPEALKPIGAALVQHKPRFFVHVGDMLNNGHVYYEWNPCFFEPLEGVLSTVPLMAARGNHDGGNYVRRLLGSRDKKLYYSFDYANAHFVVLDSSLYDAASRRAMLEWCEADLAASKADWKFVYCHHPHYDAGANEPDCWGRKDFVPVFRKHGVDISLTGHTHAYQRFLPMFTAGENDAHPITFMVVGGAGGGTMRVSRDPYLAASRSANHYVVFSISGKRLRAKALTVDGEEIDAFEIHKNDDGSLDRDYVLKAVPEEGYGVLRELVKPCFRGLSLSDDPMTGRAAKVKVNVGAGERAMKFTIQLERRAAKEWEMAPVKGEVGPGQTLPVELSITLKHPSKYGDGKGQPAVLRVECIFEIDGQTASVFSNRLAWSPAVAPRDN